jgi:purine nucleoside phosphorylase
MSAATELERCQVLGMRAGIISCVTNDCTSQESLSHAQVVAVAERASGELCEILRNYLALCGSGNDSGGMY